MKNQIGIYYRGVNVSYRSIIMPKAYLHLPDMAMLKVNDVVDIRRISPSGVESHIQIRPDKNLLELYTVEEICLVCYMCLTLGYSTVGDATEMLDAISYDHQRLYARALEDVLSPEHSSGIIKVFNDLVYLSYIHSRGHQQFEVGYVVQE